MMQGGGKESWYRLQQEEAGSDASPCSCSQTPTLFLLECVSVSVIFVYAFSVLAPREARGTCILMTVSALI